MIDRYSRRHWPNVLQRINLSVSYDTRAGEKYLSRTIYYSKDPTKYYILMKNLPKNDVNNKKKTSSIE